MIDRRKKYRGAGEKTLHKESSIHLGFDLAGIGLLDKELLSLSLGLLRVNGLHQHALILELITLRSGI